MRTGRCRSVRAQFDHLSRAKMIARLSRSADTGLRFVKAHRTPAEQAPCSRETGDAGPTITTGVRVARETRRRRAGTSMRARRRACNSRRRAGSTRNRAASGRRTVEACIAAGRGARMRAARCRSVKQRGASLRVLRGRGVVTGSTQGARPPRDRHSDARKPSTSRAVVRIPGGRRDSRCPRAFPATTARRRGRAWPASTRPHVEPRAGAAVLHVVRRTRVQRTCSDRRTARRRRLRLKPGRHRNNRGVMRARVTRRNATPTCNSGSRTRTSNRNATSGCRRHSCGRGVALREACVGIQNPRAIRTALDGGGEQPA